MKHLDLFSGIGGFHLAGEMVWGKDFNTICHVEIDPFCQKILKKHWPDVPICSDIRSYKHEKTKVNLITGGFPCQGFSVAGKRKGTKDDRYLWPEMFKIIKAVRPDWVIAENVAGITSMGIPNSKIEMESKKNIFGKGDIIYKQRQQFVLDRIITDLETSRYFVQTFIVPACAVNAPHRRDRVWIVAYTSIKRRARGQECDQIDRCNRRQEIYTQR